MSNRPKSKDKAPAKKRRLSRPAGAVSSRPVVAIVGRPNVGKSTLFNRLAGARLAITEDIPGVTRDRHYADAEAYGYPYILIDTGGFDPDADDPMVEGIGSQVQLALEECDVVVAVFDATVDPTPADLRVAELLRRTEKPVFFAASKADSRSKSLLANSYYGLGIEHIYPISGLHGHGVGDLEEAIVEAFEERDRAQEEAQASGGVRRGDGDWEALTRVAIIGRPNAGKSSLVNRLAGVDQQIVDSRPGTTMDSIDTLIEQGGERYVLIDTAGMRRRRAVGKKGVEGLSVLRSIRSMERADIAVLLIDANEGAAEQDAKIAGLAEQRGCGLIIGLNKCDLVDRQTMQKVQTRAKEILAFVPWASVCVLSAEQGVGIRKLVNEWKKISVERDKRISTGELNRFFSEVLETHPPPTSGTKPVRLFFITQAEVSPPLFTVVTNEPKNVHFSYQRYVSNQIRKRFGFAGTPLRIRYRAKKKVELK